MPIRNKKQARQQWSQLSDVPCDDDDCIEQSFLHFEVGTNKFTICQWFEEEYNCSVVDHLIGTEHES